MNSLPIVIGEVGVNHTDHATRRFHLDSQRQGAQAGRNAFTNITNAGIQPSATVDAMIDIRNRISLRPSPRHQIVISIRSRETTDAPAISAHRPIQGLGPQGPPRKTSGPFLAKILPQSARLQAEQTTDNPINSFVQIIVLALIIFFAQRRTSGLGARLAGGIAFDADIQEYGAGYCGHVVNPKTTRRDMQSGMMVTAGRTNHMIAGNTMWNPAYRQHVLQNMGKNWDRQRAAPSTVSDVHVASASASPSARPFHSWAHISPHYAWATPSVASRVRSCRTGRGGRPSGFALFLPPADRLHGFQRHQG